MLTGRTDRLRESIRSAKVGCVEAAPPCSGQSTNGLTGNERRTSTELMMMTEWLWVDNRVLTDRLTDRRMGECLPLSNNEWTNEWMNCSLLTSRTVEVLVRTWDHTQTDRQVAIAGSCNVHLRSIVTSMSLHSQSAIDLHTFNPSLLQLQINLFLLIFHSTHVAYYWTGNNVVLYFCNCSHRPAFWHALTNEYRLIDWLIYWALCEQLNTLSSLSLNYTTTICCWLAIRTTKQSNTWSGCHLTQCVEIAARCG